MSDIVKVLPYSIDMEKPIEKTEMHTLFLMGDNMAHRIELTITRGNVPADLSGCEANGYFVNFKENESVKLPAVIEGGKVSVTLKKSCYAYHGQFTLIIQIKSGDVEASVFDGEGFMRRSRTETIIYDDYIVYDVSTLLSQITKMETATKDAQDAAAAANMAAEHAPYIDADSGHWMTWDVEKGVYVDTGVDAAGPQGKPGTHGQTPYIGENGNWWIGDNDTGTPARGADGTMTFEELTDEQRESLKGEPGVSPAVEITDVIEDIGGEDERTGKKITITDAEGAKECTILDGKDGGAVYFGVNPISGEENDTPENWHALGDGRAWYNGDGILIDKPETYGILINLKLKGIADISQMFCGTSGAVYTRNGNVTSGWTTTWTKFQTEADGGSSDPLDAYPVGSIYMSVSSTSPASLFGGTWEQLKDRFLLGAGNTYSNGATGGSATHTLTANQLPKITGNIQANSGSQGISGGGYGAFRNVDGTVFKGEWPYQYGAPEAGIMYSSSGSYGKVTMSFGGGEAHNNMPPYLAVYMWKRTE